MAETFLIVSKERISPDNDQMCSRREGLVVHGRIIFYPGRIILAYVNTH